jgi:outer membrane lipoprotein SlyB
LTKQPGISYAVKTKGGSIVSVVQGPTPAFSVGQHVLVEYGIRARIVDDPSYGN